MSKKDREGPSKRQEFREKRRRARSAESLDCDRRDHCHCGINRWRFCIL